MRGSKCKHLRKMVMDDSYTGMPLVNPEEDSPQLRLWVYKQMKKTKGQSDKNNLWYWIYPGALATEYFRLRNKGIVK